MARASAKSVTAIPIVTGESVWIYVPFRRADTAAGITSDLGDDESLESVTGTDGNGQALGADEVSGAILCSDDEILATAQTLPDGTTVEADTAMRFLAAVDEAEAVVGREYEVKVYATTDGGQTLCRIVRVLVEA